MTFEQLRQIAPFFVYFQQSGTKTARNLWMLSFSSILTDKNANVALNHYKVLKLKVRAFAAQQHHQGWISIPVDAVELGKLNF